MDKYGLYNETKNQWEYVISDIEPTVLPDNPVDSIKADSIHIIEENIHFGDGTKIVSSLGNYKQMRYSEIDNKTGKLITGGFEYPASSGNIFSFSENAQNNLLGTFSAKDLLTYPFPWNTKDDTLTYQIADVTEMTSFFMTALATKKAHQDSGSALKAQVRDAVDEAAVDAIIDNR